MDKPQWLFTSSPLPDFRLIPKHLEGDYKHAKTSSQKIEENILPRYQEMPPLLADLLHKSGEKETKLKTLDPKYESSLYRVAKEGEQPTRQFESGFGTPLSPNLYKNVNYDI